MNSKKELKEFLLKILSEITNSGGGRPQTAPTVEPDIKTKPSTSPPAPTQEPNRRRKLTPDRWPEETPGPKPKAEGKEVSIEEVIKEMKIIEELTRMKTLISENRQIAQEMAMNIEDPEYETPNPSVRTGIEGGKKTAFSDSEFFKGGTPDYSTLEKIGSEEFNQIIKDVKPFGKMNMQEFMQAFQLMSSIEMPNKEALEALAIRKIKEQFGLPDEVSDKLEAKLVRQVNKPDEDTDNLEQEVEKDLQFTDEEKEIIRQHVEKRKLQNALMMGAGFRAHSAFRSIKNDLDAIDPRLHPLYEKTMPNVALFMWQYPLEDMMGGVTMMGLSKLKKDENNNVKAEAQATIFPILLHETAKAAIELLFAYYLIDLTEKYGKNVSSEIIKQSDVFEEEIWHKRIGPKLWKYLHDVIDYVIVHDKESNYTLVSYLLHDISMMEPAEFVNFMTNIVYNGEKSIEIVSQMVDVIEHDLERSGEADQTETETNDENLLRTANRVGDTLAKLTQSASEKQQSQENVAKDFVGMSVEELQIELQDAIDTERYEDAAKITKIIKSKI